MRIRVVAALCVVSAFFAVPKAEADIVVRFLDTGSGKSAAEASGSFDLSGYTASLTRVANNIIGLEVPLSGGISTWVVATGGNSLPYAPPAIALDRRALVSYGGRTTAQSNLGSFAGDFRISVQYKGGGSNSDWEIGFDNAHVESGTASYSDERVTYEKSLQELLGDTDFHVEFVFGTQKLTFTTRSSPGKPDSLAATAGDAQVTLTWDDQSGDANADSWQYRQRPSGSASWGSWTDISNSDNTTTAYTVAAGLANGTTYEFQIRAIGVGFDGAESDIVTATPKAAPARPTILDVVPGRQLIRVTVPTLANATSWQARCRTENGEFGTWAGAVDAADPDNGNNRVVTISGLTDGTPYICQVRALNGTVEGTASSETTKATPHTRPPAPANFAADPGNGQATLRWTDPENDNITGYEYAQKTDGEYGAWIPFQATGAVGSNVLRYTVAGLTNRTVYTFRLRAVTAGYKDAPSSEATVTPDMMPGKPAWVALNPGDARVELVWADQSGDAAGIGKWQYRQRASGDQNWSAWTDIPVSDGVSPAAMTSYAVATGLANGTTFEFQIRAVTTGGVNGTASDARQATPAAPPAAPTGLAAGAGSMRATLSWTAPSPANPHIVRYEYRQKTTGEFEDWKRMDITENVATATSYAVTGLVNGTAYTFEIRAATVGGASPPSGQASATPNVAPGKPQGFRLEPGNATVKLIWNDQSDDPAGIAKWQIREKVGDGEWGAWSEIAVTANAGAGTLEHVRTRLTNGETHGYRIRAVATGNPGDLYGEESDEEFATPADAPAAATLTATPGTKRVLLSWRLDAADASVGKWQYQTLQGRVDANAFADVAWTEVPGSDATTRSHTVLGLEGDVAFSFRVRAVGYGGEGAASGVATATPEPAPSAEEERRVLKRTLAAVAQATVSGAADTIAQRFESAPGSRSLTLAGRQIGGSPGASAGTGSAADSWFADADAGDRIGRWLDDPSNGVGVEDPLRGSAFALSLAGEDWATGGPHWTLWGRGDRRAFEGRKSADRWDGKEMTGWLGVDARLNERLMAGVAASHGEGEADYRLDEFEGRLETSLTAVWPYLQVRSNDGGAVRLVLGAGTGDTDHRRFDGEAERADLTMLAGSVSGRLPLARRNGFALSALAGASLAQIETDGSTGSAIDGLTAKAWRLRAGMEVEHDGFPLSSGSGWRSRTRGALAVRQDGGDGVTGAGMEVSGGVRLSAPGGRFGLDASGHWLALHSEDGAGEWGASLEVRLAPRADGRGLSLAIGPEWGQQQDGALTREWVFDERRDPDAPQPLSLNARAGYGLAAYGGLVTPFAELAFSGEPRIQRYRAGVGFARNGVDAAMAVGHRSGAESDTRVDMEMRLHLHR